MICDWALGLFLEPGGRPLGLRPISMVAPSLQEGLFGLGPPLLRVSSSSEVWHSREG
ncbi:hypothetical protein MtrunA17_Chr5g0427321 [Medicago truncatula]|uniref:Uncharacterized protein n=1 Tax=Medicago truncatula TaxID=3880 RepID=I3SSV9_MEDTR|nr:unknown [Medicago truncatula]RHN56240.1 hypothetical protein MtrunA17_Chr5g0427321 [Medicago truncatula]